jgi:hypothetical protein
MGLWFKITEGLTRVIQKKKENFCESANLNQCLKSFVDQAVSFMHYLRNGNDDFGKTKDELQ